MDGGQIDNEGLIDEYIFLILALPWNKIRHDKISLNLDSDFSRLILYAK